MKPVLIEPPPILDAMQGPLHAGLLVADSYRLASELGAGAMGTVWKAQHVVLGHSVAIKFLRASFEAYPRARLRFEREGKLAARLAEDSRHICRVTDYGIMPTGTPFVVMELLQGEPLAQRLKREPVLPLAVLTDIVTQLCRALTAAHRANVVHRDLKPGNVFLCTSEDSQDPLVKLLDFGVAHAPLEDDTEGTAAGTVIGAPSYMSPEQISGAPIDARADLWSLAVVAYRMATGRTPFGAGTLYEMGLRILTLDPPAPSSLRPELPPAFDTWMKKALAKEREERFASAIELSDALLAASSVRQRESSVRSGVRRVLSVAAPRRASRGLELVIALLAVGLLVFAIVWASGPHPAPAPHARQLRPASSKAPQNPTEGAPAARVPEASPSQPSVGSEPEAPTLLLPTIVAPPEPVRERAPRRGAEARRRAPAADTLKERATELWHKTDEL